MPTARDVITSAARTAKIIGADELLEAEDAQSGLGIFNSMLQAWPINGIDYDSPLLTSLDDTVDVPDAFIEATRYLLAEKLAVDFGVVLEANALAEVSKSRSVLQSATNSAPRVKVDRALRRMFVNRMWGRYGWYNG